MNERQKNHIVRDRETESVQSARVFFRRSQFWSLVTGAAAGAALCMFWSKSIGYGFMAGVVVGMLNGRLMAVDAFSLVHKEPSSVRKFIIGRQLLRLMIMFGFLALIATRTEWNIFAAFAGLFLANATLIVLQVKDVLVG